MQQLIHTINWIDIIIFALLLFFLIEGYLAGFYSIFPRFISYISAFITTNYFHESLALKINLYSGLAQNTSVIISFLAIFIVTLVIYQYIFQLIMGKVLSSMIRYKINNWLGSMLGIINGLVLITVLLVFASKIPLSAKLKNSIQEAKTAPILINTAYKLGGRYTESVSELALKAAKFITVDPGSKQTIYLPEKPPGELLNVDANGEQDMFEKVNDLRIRNGTVPLSIDLTLTGIARDHSRDMFEEGYFSHYDLEGLDIKDRLDKADFQYSRAAENIAFAPSIEMAMTGFMESRGHRENILNASSTRIGIGIIDAGIYGKMITQVFSDTPYYFFNK